MGMLAGTRGAHIPLPSTDLACTRQGYGTLPHSGATILSNPENQLPINTRLSLTGFGLGFMCAVRWCVYTNLLWTLDKELHSHRVSLLDSV